MSNNIVGFEIEIISFFDIIDITKSNSEYKNVIKETKGE